MFYNIFAGTSSFAEVRLAFRYLLSFRFKDRQIIDAFHAAAQEATGTKYAFSFGSGRISLFMALQALGIRDGDEVILPAYTCVVVANAIHYAGAKPVYVDIDPVTFNIDVSKIATAITPRTKAILAQHTFGLICDIDTIRAIAKKHGLRIIEDSVHALGIEHKGEKVGALGDLAYFSTDNSKVISTFSGGFVTTNDPELAKKLDQLWHATPWLRSFDYFRIGVSFILAYFLYSPRSYRWTRYILRVLSKFRVLFYFRDELLLERPTHYRFPCRMSSLQAAIGLSQLRNLDSNLSHRKEIGLKAERLMGCLGERLLEQGSNHSFLRYSFLVDDRASFLKAFSNQYDLGIWFTSVLHGRMQNLDKLGYQTKSCPIAEDVAKRIVNIPTHYRIPVDPVIAALSAYETHVGTESFARRRRDFLSLSDGLDSD